ncbi:hypothetical protein [Rhodopseudomonas sp. BR0G17]|uniref:hypothetical protein n=1 Tax=Rhodopseudomonas sp. BR0G17 TaxID=2269368 RepID=UPI0013E0CFB9|nr:hypothetical protein [Rhodopseudomonas sp. BR0G17]
MLSEIRKTIGELPDLGAAQGADLVPVHRDGDGTGIVTVDAITSAGANAAAAAAAAVLASKANLDSPTFINTPTAPTPAAGDSSQKLATTQYVDRILPTGHISGLIWSRNAANPSTRIDITAGKARSSDDTLSIILPAMTKRIDATFVAGSGNGGLDTGAVAANSGYYLWAIARSDQAAAADVLISLSATAPSLPTSWDKKRLLGYVATDASAAIIDFLVFEGGDCVLFNAMLPLSLNSSNLPNGTWTTFSVPVPAKAEAVLGASIQNSSSTSALMLLSTDLPNFGVSASGSPLATIIAGNGMFGGAKVNVRVSASSQLKATPGAAGTQVFVQCYGWNWRRAGR